MCSPFSITTQPFGGANESAQPQQFIVYRLSCGETGEYISVMPQFGGILQQLVLRKDGQLLSLLKTPASTEALLADESYASAFLFPFASRIPGGLYWFEGKQYALETNEPGGANAIHGLVHRQCFSVIGQQATETKASLSLQYTYPGDAAGYPFPFTFSVTYELNRGPQSGSDTPSAGSQSCRLQIRYSACNTGTKPCPVGFGWHPYFKLGERSIDKLTLRLPDRSGILLNDDLQPTGYEPPEAAGTISLQSRELDNVFAIVADASGFTETVLACSSDTQLVVSQQTGPNKLSFLICYTPPKRDCIAIEPQTANVNAFNNGDGLTVLDPGNSLAGLIRIRLK